MDSTLKLISDKLQRAGDSIGEVQNVGNTERLISVIAGIALTFYGLQKKKRSLGKE